MFQDITNNPQTHYRIDRGGEQVFFFVNRSGELVFDVTHPKAHVRIIGLYRGRGNDRFSLTTTQNHTAPGARSDLTIQSALSETAMIEHQGTIRIENGAQHTQATLESRHILLNSGTRATAKPHLEILADDVSCSHAVTTSPINPELLSYLTSRTIDAKRAANLLVEGFLTAPMKNFSSDVVHTALSSLIRHCEE